MIRFKALAISEIGTVRKNNEDNLYISGEFRSSDFSGELYYKSMEKITDCSLFAVCDGMGGEAFGEEASWIAVSGLSFIENHLIRRQEIDFAELIASYLRQANKRVCDRIKEHDGIRMGTTFAALCLRHQTMQVANLGDSRIYQYRDRKLRQLTVDHTQAQNLADLGMISEEEVKTHPERHALIQHLGIFPQEFALNPSISESAELKAGDLFLLCSDGLSDKIDDEKMAELLGQGEDLRVTAEKLVQAALSASGQDNISLILVSVTAVDSTRLTREAGVAERTALENALYFENQDRNTAKQARIREEDLALNALKQGDTAPIRTRALLQELSENSARAWQKKEARKEKARRKGTEETEAEEKTGEQDGGQRAAEADLENTKPEDTPGTEQNEHLGDGEMILRPNEEHFSSATSALRCMSEDNISDVSGQRESQNLCGKEAPHGAEEGSSGTTARTKKEKKKADTIAVLPKEEVSPAGSSRNLVCERYRSSVEELSAVQRKAKIRPVSDLLVSWPPLPERKRVPEKEEEQLGSSLRGKHALLEKSRPSKERRQEKNLYLFASTEEIPKLTGNLHEPPLCRSAAAQREGAPVKDDSRADVSENAIQEKGGQGLRTAQDTIKLALHSLYQKKTEREESEEQTDDPGRTQILPLTFREGRLYPSARELANQNYNDQQRQKSEAETVLFSKELLQPITTDDLERFQKARAEAMRRQEHNRSILPDNVRYGEGWKGKWRKRLKIERDIQEVYEELAKSPEDLRRLKRKRFFLELIKMIFFIGFFSFLAILFYLILRFLWPLHA